MSERHEVAVWWAPVRGSYEAQCICGWRGGKRTEPEFARLTGVEHVRASRSEAEGALSSSSPAGEVAGVET
jgi:hypothetical protein